MACIIHDPVKVGFSHSLRTQIECRYCIYVEVDGRFVEGPRTRYVHCPDCQSKMPEDDTDNHWWHTYKCPKYGKKYK